MIRTTTVCVFSLLSAAAIWLLGTDLRPPPLYRTMAAARALTVVRGADVRIEFTPPRAPRAILLPAAIATSSVPLRVDVTEATTGRALAHLMVEASGTAIAEFLRLPRPGHLLRVRLSSEAEAAAQAPRVFQSREAPAFDAVATHGAALLAGSGPLLLLEYPWRSQHVLWFWCALSPLLWAAWRSARWAPSALVAIGLCATMTSHLWWQYDYTRHFGHRDADQFGRYATTLTRYVTEPVSRPAGRVWFRSYDHAHTPLGPVALTPPLAVGLPIEFVYPWLTSVWSMASLALLFDLLRRRLGLPCAVAAGAVIFTCSHILIVRMFARPVTDALGFLLTIASLHLVLARVGGAGRRNTVALGILNLMHALARPQGIALVPIFTLLALVGDWWRRGRLSLSEVLGRGAALAGPPLLILGAMFLFFGWIENLQAFLAERPLFRRWSTIADFRASAVVLVQLLPVCWLPVWRRRGDPRLRLLLLWMASYLSLLVAARAPFWGRHFLPVLPAIVAVTTVGVHEMQGHTRRAAVALLLFLATANVAAVATQLITRTDLRLAFKRVATLG
jgi:hypothetical protein